MFRPHMWAIFRLQSNFSNFSGAAIQDVWGVGVGGRGGGRDLVCFNSGYHDLGRLQVDYL